MTRMQKRRVILNIVILACLGGVAIGVLPTLQNRAAASSGQRVRSGAAEAPIRATAGEWGAEAPALPDAERAVQQAQVIREELAARERRVAAQEDLLRREVLSEFWRRQAAATSATLGIALIIVLVVVRRAADWSGFSKRLREEESRLRNLQLSVIGALEEFESELTAARAWAAAEARSRRPAADAHRAEAVEMHAEAHARPAPPASDRGFFERVAALAPAPEGAIEPDGYYFGEDEYVGEAEPIASAPAPVPEEPPMQPRTPDSWARRFLAPEAPPAMAAPVPAPPRRVVEAPAPQAGPWGEPARRPGPMPGPRRQPQVLPDGTPTREQVEQLAAQGCGEAEIARRLGLSREEIHLALMLGRTARADQARAASAGPTQPYPGWQSRERASYGPGAR